MDFELSLFLGAMPSLLKGARTTALLALITIGVSIVLGVLGGLARVSGWKPIAAFMLIYVTVMRGVPTLVTLLLLYYGLPSLGILLDGGTVAVIGLSLTSAAYIAEIVRSAIEAIDPGQMKAARALGMPASLAMRRIVLPQALRNVLPPLTNEAITILKNTSLVSVIAVPELLHAGMDFMTWKANTFSPFAGVALTYLVMSLPLIGLNAWFETRWARR